MRTPVKHIMFRKIALGCVVGLIPLFVLASCERETQKSVPAPAVGIQPPTVAATEPATQPTTSPTDPVAATLPAAIAGTQLMVNQTIQQFPAARMRIVTSGDHLAVVVYSADPDTAIDNDYKGNSFYMTLSLPDVKDASGLDGAEWRFKSVTSDVVDTTEGIFLDGFRYHLEPMDAIVKFEGVGPVVKLRLAGQFRSFDSSTPHQPGILTPVGGEIDATIESPTTKPKP